MSESLSDICKVLRKQKSVVITSHISPDADAVSSSCGLAIALRDIGLQTQVYLADKVPTKYAPFLKSITPVHTVSEIVQPVDCVISVDAATRQRIGPEVEQFYALAPVSINLDHHISNGMFAQHNYVDAESASSAEIVLDICRELNIEIEEDLATLLMSGLVEDTGSFRFSNSRPQTFLNAAFFVQNGAKVEFIAEQLFFNVPEHVLKLRKAALQTLEVHFGGRVSFLYADSAMLEASGATSEDTDGLVDEARSVAGTVGALFLRQLSDGWKASVRAKDRRFDAQGICAAFGGGGHAAAAGCTIRASFEEAKRQLLAVVEEHLRKGGLLES